MAEKTKNYGLTKPNAEDFYDVNTQNENMDIIDEQLKNRIPVLATYYPTNSAKNADELTDAFALIPVSLEVNSELFNIIGGTFAWVWTNFYVEATVTSHRVQIAMSYDATEHKMAFRIYSTNGWSVWKGFADVSHTHAVSDISGTLPISKGGTGSTSATAAITNLGAASKNHKHTATDINSGTFSSDRFPVIPITKGGTGASNSSQARANLGITQEYWTFTLEDGSTVTKLVCAT